MTLAEIQALGTQTDPVLIKPSDYNGYFAIFAGEDGGDAVPMLVCRTAGLTGASEIRNFVAITMAGYAAITPDVYTYYAITDAAMSDFGAFVMGQWLADTSATTATPGPGDLRWNNATQTDATALYIDSVTAGTVNLAGFLKLAATAGRLYLQDASNTANFQLWKISATPSVDSENWTFPVTLVSSGGTGTTGFADNLNLLVALGPAAIADQISGYVAPQTLTSSASISMDVTAGTVADLAHNHNATITLSNLLDGVSGTIRGTMASATKTLTLAHSGLTLREMGGSMGTIATLDTADLWTVAYQRAGSNLLTWTTIKEI